MKTYRFEVAEHEEFGGLGYKPTWYPEGDPLGGMAVAHDILEHFPNDNGKAEGEFLALGAALWLRGDAGYFRNGTPEENIASDFPDIWSHVVYEDKRTFIMSCKPSRNSELMERCRNTVRLGCRNLGYEFDPEDMPPEETRENIACWLSKGYQKAKSRYRRVDQYAIGNYIFRQIQDEADRKLKHAEEGMILTVTLNLKRASYSMRLDYPSDY